jgi:2-amino-4-hydroxy-6-hydroxymethyldihydropteridine diphosphokinase/dihydropteroate synthase
MIYISLGSNLGNRLENIRTASELLRREVFTELRCLPILETEAITPDGAPDEWCKAFLNTIVYGESALAPKDLLRVLKEIEVKLGRPADHKRWEPRIIDLDILLYNDLVLETSELVVPHPELCNRPFLVQLLALIDPCLKHPDARYFGEIARGFPDINESFQKAMVLAPKLVGVVNVTPDSFSDGGVYFDPAKAIAGVLGLARDGATLVELGAQSTRPGAAIISADEEYSRLAPVLDGLLEEMRSGAIRISLDSFYPEVISKTLQRYPIVCVNDVKGRLDDETLKAIAAKNCKLVVMHSLSVPAKKGEYLPDDEPAINQINDWINKTLQRLLACGFREEMVIFDPGIGFGKSAYQSLDLIRCAEQIKSKGCEVMFGHSRKSYIASFSKASTIERDLETIAISDYLSRCGIDYLRVHNVKDHQRFFVAKQLVHGGVYVH